MRKVPLKKKKKKKNCVFWVGQFNCIRWCSSENYDIAKLIDKIFLKDHKGTLDKIF